MENQHRFETCLAFVLAKEGGYVNNPADPGGATNLGISLRYAVSLGRVVDLDGDGDVDAADIRLITRDIAALLYRKDFWSQVRADELPAPLDLVMFDSAVNCGSGAAVRWLQAAAGAGVDGSFGPKTLAAVQKADPGALVREVLARRGQHYATLSTVSTFGLGWFRRLAALAVEAGKAAA